MDPWSERLGPTAALTVAALLSGVSAAVTLQDSPSEHAVLEAVARASMVAAPIAVGPTPGGSRTSSASGAC